MDFRKTETCGFQNSRLSSQNSPTREHNLDEQGVDLRLLELFPASRAFRFDFLGAFSAQNVATSNGHQSDIPRFQLEQKTVGFERIEH